MLIHTVDVMSLLWPIARPSGRRRSGSVCRDVPQFPLMYFSTSSSGASLGKCIGTGCSSAFRIVAFNALFRSEASGKPLQCGGDSAEERSAGVSSADRASLRQPIGRT